MNDIVRTAPVHAAMEQLRFASGELIGGGMALSTRVARLGCIPFHDRGLLDRRVGSRRAVVLAASVMGPLCTPLDLLRNRMSVLNAQPRDSSVVHQSGPYVTTACPQGILDHLAVSEALV